MNNSQPLTHETIVSAALVIADKDGLESLSMRKLGRQLGVEAMAIYHHFASKEQLREAMLGAVHAEIVVPENEQDWRVCMKARATSVIETLRRHPWAATLMESGKNPTAATMNERECVARCLRQNGFSVEATVHAMTLLDIYIYGAAQQYVALAFTTATRAAAVAKHVEDKFSAEDFPYFAEILTEHVGAGKYDPLDEFYFGLNLVFDSIERLRTSTPA